MQSLATLSQHAPREALLALEEEDDDRLEREEEERGYGQLASRQDAPG